MYPVSYFYFIFASNVKKSLKIYYKTLNLEFNNWVYFEHLRMFAMCLCDRFISKYDPSSYTFVYENGKKLKYSEEFIEDEYGFLADQPIDLLDFENFIINKSDFEYQWQK